MEVNKQRYLGGSVQGGRSPAADIDVGSHWHIDRRSSFPLENNSYQLAEPPWRAVHTRTRHVLKSELKRTSNVCLGRYCALYFPSPYRWGLGLWGWLWWPKESVKQEKRMERSAWRNKQAKETGADHHLLICSFIQQVTTELFLCTKHHFTCWSHIQGAGNALFQNK